MAWRSASCPHPERGVECAAPTVLAVRGATRDLANTQTGDRWTAVNAPSHTNRQSPKQEVASAPHRLTLRACRGGREAENGLAGGGARPFPPPEDPSFECPRVAQQARRPRACGSIIGAQQPWTRTGDWQPPHSGVECVREDRRGRPSPTPAAPAAHSRPRHRPSPSLPRHARDARAIVIAREALRVATAAPDAALGRRAVHPIRLLVATAGSSIPAVGAVHVLAGEEHHIIDAGTQLALEAGGHVAAADALHHVVRTNDDRLGRRLPA